MNPPCLDDATGVGDDDRANVDTPGERLVGEREVGQRLVDRDGHRDVGASTAVVRKDRVGSRRLVGGRATADRSVRKHQIAGQGGVNPPCLNETTGV